MGNWKIIVLLLFSLPAFGQKAAFREMRLMPNPKYYNRREVTIIYPIVVINDPQLSKLINDEIKYEVFGINKSDNLTKELKSQINDGLTDLSYTATFNKNNILSLNIFIQGNGGSHLTSNTEYLNFDLLTGKQISLSDLFDQSRLIHFQNMVSSDRKDSIEKYKLEEWKLLLKKGIDSVTYDRVVEEIGDSQVTFEFHNYLLSGNNLEIKENIQFPVIIRSQEPTYHLMYSYKAIQDFLNPSYRSRLLK
jgi:hypothetical protein